MTHNSYVLSDEYAERVYAGLLGKAIGVYLGRPVEGWEYSRIQAEVGTVDQYINSRLGLPLIVADDDLSASLLFARALEHADCLTPDVIRETWLTYVAEKQTVLWWGGYGRSTEQTAFINLKDGMLPPESGSAQVNGPVISQQIGAQIFHDVHSLYYPLEPDRAAFVSREAASASHDGIALDITSYFAALRSLAFTGEKWQKLCRDALPWIGTTSVLSKCKRRVQAADVVHRVLEIASDNDWRTNRDIVDQEFGYGVMPGPCHSVSNFAISLLALLQGRTPLEALTIAASAGFDTDSNAGLVGLLSGINSGIDGIKETNLWQEVADRLILVSAQGSDCITDVAREASVIIETVRGRSTGSAPRSDAIRSRLDFPWEGVTHGFTRCPYIRRVPTQPSIVRRHATEVDACRVSQRRGLSLCSDGQANVISIPTFLDPLETSTNFRTIGTPRLFPGSRVTVTFDNSSPTVVRFYTLFDTPAGVLCVPGETHSIQGKSDISVTIPSVDNYAPFRIGFEIESETEVVLSRLVWCGAGTDYRISGNLQADIWDLQPRELSYWISDAENFEADFDLCVALADQRGPAHARLGGLWSDIEASATVRIGQNKSAGIAARTQGLRHGIAALIVRTDNDARQFQIIHQSGEEIRVLAKSELSVHDAELCRLTLNISESTATAVCRPASDRSVTKTHLTADLQEGDWIAEDLVPPYGGVGLWVERGACSFDDFRFTVSK